MVPSVGVGVGVFGGGGGGGNRQGRQDNKKYVDVVRQDSKV